MPLVKFQFKPGINKEVTAYANDGGWLDSDKIRFRLGRPEKIGGWAKNSPNTFDGTCRAIHTYKDTDLTHYNVLGTHQKLYVQEGDTFYDVTAVRNTTAAGDVTFAISNGSSTLTVNDTNHGCNPGDFVRFRGAVSLGGNVTAAVLNTEYKVLANVNANSYTIALDVTANGSGAYRFDQYGSTDNPTLYGINGTTIAFNLSAMSSSHPFLIQNSSGVNYSTGLIHVATNGTCSVGSAAQGKESGTLYWKIPSSISGTYRYQCSLHGGMVGAISVKNFGSI